MKISKHYKDNLEKLPKLSKKQQDELYEIEKEAIAKFKGQLQELESALGMLRIGYYYGWKVLYIAHNKRTIRKYEEYLDINVRDFFEEEAPLSHRNYGYKMYQAIGRFWKIVSGEEKVQNRKDIE